MEDEKKVLSHVGVLGMKWGRRSGNSGKDGHKSSTDRKVLSVIKGKKIKQMTNKQLKAATERLRLEKEYKALAPSKISTGRKVLTDLLSNAGKETAKIYVSRAMVKGVDAVIKGVIENATRIQVN